MNEPSISMPDRAAQEGMERRSEMLARTQATLTDGAELARAMPEAFGRRPAHRPRRDPLAARVNLCVRVHPATLAALVGIAGRLRKSRGETVDLAIDNLARMPSPCS